MNFLMTKMKSLRNLKAPACTEHGRSELVEGLRLFLGAFLLLFLVACHNTHQVPGTTPVYYSNDRAVSLLSTSAMTESIDMPQHIAGKFRKPDGTTDLFEADSWVRANDSILSIVLFSGFGTTIGEISYYRDSVKAESSLIDVEKLKAEYMLADFQVCFYPFEALRQNFEQAGFDFSETRTGSQNTDFVRTLAEKGVTIAVARKNGNEIEFVNELRGYSYHITLGDAN